MDWEDGFVFLGRLRIRAHLVKIEQGPEFENVVDEQRINWVRLR